MSLSTSVQSRVPPGFRFHPTEEELLSYYLRKKVACDKIDLDVIREIDLNKHEPWEIQEKCKLGSAPQNDWYFFSHKDKKYPTGTRTNRATASGFWKATGRDKAIYASSKRIGMRKTLVFYRGRAPYGQKSDWIMHEYRLLDDHHDGNFPSNVTGFIGETPAQEDGWVVCRVFKKKNHLKPSDGCHDSSIGQDRSQMMDSRSNDDLDQVLQYIGTSWKHESDNVHDSINITNQTNNRSNNFGYYCLNQSAYQRFIQVPASESPASNLLPIDFPSDSVNVDGSQRSYPLENKDAVNGWAAVDRLVASHLNGESEASQEQLATFDDLTSLGCSSNSVFVDSHGDAGLWSLTQLSSSTTDCSSRVLHGTV